VPHTWALNRKKEQTQPSEAFLGFFQETTLHALPAGLCDAYQPCSTIRTPQRIADGTLLHCAQTRYQSLTALPCPKLVSLLSPQLPVLPLLTNSITSAECQVQLQGLHRCHNKQRFGCMFWVEYSATPLQVFDAHCPSPHTQTGTLHTKNHKRFKHCCSACTAAAHEQMQRDTISRTGGLCCAAIAATTVSSKRTAVVATAQQLH
jgi:hypothetical protein